MYEAEKPRLRASPVEMDEALDELLRVLPSATASSSEVDPSLDGLIEDVRTRSVAVQVALTHLADLAETVEIAVHNMEAQGFVDMGATDGTYESPLARDRALGRALVDQSHRDLAYLRRAAERATARLTALQAALVGTLLALFTLNTAFENPAGALGIGLRPSRRN